HGHSLSALLLGGEIPKDSVAITEALEYGGRDSYSVRLVGSGRHQLIFSPSWEKRDMDAGDRQNYYWLSRVSKYHGVEYYDLDRDPMVRKNLANKDLDGLDHAKSILEAFFQNVKPMAAPTSEDKNAPPSEDLKERLKALGY
ncbi:MAG: hypothetical protein JO102_05950, partial [Elusimicrobia bacterium]|nr:hypothetical protein [Elusimicrobiota bacterium]